MWAWIVVARAAEPAPAVSPTRPTDLSVTSIGADAVSAQAIGQQNADFLIGQRLRWTVSDGGRVLIDGRFVVDPAAAVRFEDSRLRELGFAYESQGATVLVGRHPVVDGGPRLVDGLQGLANVGPEHRISLGAWAGLVPDEFTTAPTGRVGGGPILAYTRQGLSASAMGEAVFASGRSPRLGTLVLARGEVGGRFEADGRLDWLLTDGSGHSGLDDGQIFLQLRPNRAMKLEALYDGYSSLLYQSEADQNPHVTRYAERIEGLDLTPGITQDLVDPTLYHSVGASFSDHGTGSVRPELTVRARTLLAPADPSKQYSRVGATAGVGGVADGRLELDLDGNVLWVDGGMGGDVGLMATVEPNPAGAVAIDGSVRVLLDPDEFSGYPGWYADLFLDLMSRGGTSFDAGVSWNEEPSALVGQDVGISAFLRLQQWIRPGRSERGSRGGEGRSEPVDSTGTKKGAS